MKNLLKSPKMRLILIALPALAFLALCSGRLAAVVADPGPQMTQPRPRTVSAVQAQQGTITQWSHTTGTARAVRRELLRFEIPGQILEIGTDSQGNSLIEGSTAFGPSEMYPQGQVLARLEPRDASAEVRALNATVGMAKLNVQASRAALDDASAQLELTRAQQKRISLLHAQNVVSGSDLDEVRASLKRVHAARRAAESQLSAARSEVNVARARRDQARFQLDRTVLRAPFDGVIGRLNIRVGDLVSPEAVDPSSEGAMLRTVPIVFIDPSQFEITFELPESEGRVLKQGQLVRFNLPQGPQNEQKTTVSEARIHSISPLVLPPDRTIRGRAQTAVTDGDHGLRDGDVLRISIALETREQALLVPQNALIRRSNRSVIFVIDRSSSEVEERQVTVGIENDDLVEIVDGLEPGETVVTRGRQNLRQGDTVRIAESQGQQ